MQHRDSLGRVIKLSNIFQHWQLAKEETRIDKTVNRKDKILKGEEGCRLQNLNENQKWTDKKELNTLTCFTIIIILGSNSKFE